MLVHGEVVIHGEEHLGGGSEDKGPKSELDNISAPVTFGYLETKTWKSRKGNTVNQTCAFARTRARWISAAVCPTSDQIHRLKTYHYLSGQNLSANQIKCLSYVNLCFVSS
jgi:hypothetical protein